MNPRLLAVVSVEKVQRVRCQKDGCGHGVYAAIHVVEHDGRVKVLGSTCFAEIYGGEHALGRPQYMGGGRKISAEDAALLDSNTAALLAKWELAKIETEARNRERLRSMNAMQASRLEPAAPRPTPQSMYAFPAPEVTRRVASSPWPWQHPRNYSSALLRSPHGQAWFRVQHQDQSQKLAPWPLFDGWESALPAHVGTADLALGAFGVPDIGRAIKELAALGFTSPQVGVWNDFRRAF